MIINVLTDKGIVEEFWRDAFLKLTREQRLEQVCREIYRERIQERTFAWCEENLSLDALRAFNAER